MVKNGDLIDVEPDGTITVAGKPVGGGSDYTAGSNIQISEAKEISVKPELTEINKINLNPSDSCFIWGETQGGIYLESKYNSSTFKYPRLILKSANSSYKEMIISFDSTTKYYQTIIFDAKDSGGAVLNAFLTKGGKVPFVPADDGTYVLKATVSGGAVTYTWVAQ